MLSDTTETPVLRSAPGARVSGRHRLENRTRTAVRDNPDKLDAALLRIAGVCGLACVMAILDNTAVAVAQRTFMAEFGATQAIVSWTIAGYMLAFATVIPLTGWAADRFGTKRLFMWSVLMFTLGSLLCALAPNILLLIVFRILQGIGGGMVVPLCFVILTHEAGPKRVGRLMAVGGIPILLGPIGGPVLGGWLVGTFGWKSIFLVNLPVGVAAIILAAIMFPKDRPAPTDSLDIVGVLLLSPGAAIFLAGVSSIPGRHTVADRYVLLPMIVGLTLIVAFVFHVWYRADNPLIDLRLFKNRIVSNASVTLLVFSVAFVGTGVLLPSYFQMVLHATPMQAGLRMVPVGIGAVLTMPFAGAFTDKNGAGKVVLLGLPTMALGLGVFTFGVATQADYAPILLVGLLIMGMGIGCTTTPISSTVLQALTPHQVARGTTLMTVNQQAGGAMGASLMAVILTSEFNRNDAIVAANKLTELQLDASRRGVQVDPSAIPRQTLAPDFAQTVVHGLSHAYTIVFVLAVVLIASTIIPAMFLPKKPAVHPIDESRD
jgi:MFS transporter, DHA2 family, multidrug resistance protein